MRATQEWLDIIHEVKESAPLQRQTTDPYSDSGLSGISPAMSNPSAAGDQDDTARAPEVLRKTLRKEPTDDDSLKGRKRFSKRHSKNGLAAVF